MTHPDGCGCHLHVEVTCPYCMTWSGRGTTRLGTHMKKEHPAQFVSKSRNSATKLASKMLQAHQVAQEMKRLSKRGIRFLPKNGLDSATVKMVNAWLQMNQNSTDVANTLLVAGLDKAELGIKSIGEFKKIQAAIIRSAKLGDDKLPQLYPRNTLYNTNVAGEILKLAFSLNKSWSFAVHLLLLYGLDALVEQISTSGAQPPIEIASPSKEMASAQKETVRMAVQRERDTAFMSRNPNFDPDNRKKPYIMEKDLDI